MTNAWTKGANRATDVLYSIVESPFGGILIASRGRGIALVCFLDGTEPAPVTVDWTLSREHFRDTERQLAAYFRGDLEEFDVELDLQGTDFQRDVWGALTKVTYGRTASYAEIAVAVGKPTAVRAVGAANGANPIPIFIPCHRVVGTDGSLTGYRGGIEIKRGLLELESRAGGNRHALENPRTRMGSARYPSSSVPASRSAASRAHSSHRLSSE